LRRLEPVVRRALKGPCALPRGSRLLVAVSGGADSTALLLALAALRDEFDFALAAAHLHHGLRGADADADLEHVRALCGRLRVPLMAARWDTRVRMARRGLSGQAGLRTLRREFLMSARRSADAAVIATAHTADDQLETVLMRLLRGAGLRGMGGIRARSGTWIRPLLEATRADIESDLRAARQPWREDASNADPHYLRNRIRHAVIPALLEARHPGAAHEARARRASLARGVAAGARELRDAERAIAARARRLMARRGGAEQTRVWIERAALAAAPRAVRSSALRRLWSGARARTPGLTRRHLAALLGLVARGGTRERVELPDRRVASCRAGRIEIAWPARARRADVKLAPAHRSGRDGASRKPGRSIALTERV
jgi:tRNA(Ile)-lysidine synthase